MMTSRGTCVVGCIVCARDIDEQPSLSLYNYLLYPIQRCLC